MKPWERDYAQATPKPWERQYAAATEVVEQQPPADADRAILEDFRQSIVRDRDARRDMAAGAVRGAGSIGSTLLFPFDYAVDKIIGDRGRNLRSLVDGVETVSRNEERRASIDEGLRRITGADTESTAYQVGKVGAEIAGTGGIGKALGKALLSVAGNVSPRVLQLADALSTGGFSAGGATGLTGMAARTAGGAATGAASAGAVDPETASTGAAVGAAMPGATKVAGAVANTAGKFVRAVTGEMSPEARALAQRAKELGIDIPADRLTNSKPLNAVASSLNYIPMSGRAAVEEKMNRQFERAVARTVGQDGDNLSQALSKAKIDLGRKFDETLKNNTVAVDGELASDLDEVLAVADRTLGADGQRIINKQIEAIKAKAANGVIDGQAAYNIKRELDRVINTDAAQSGAAAQDLKKALMAALNRSLGPDKAAEFAEVRKQYGNMLDLDGIALRNSEEGGLSVAKLSNHEFNDPQLSEIASIARRFIREREGQHGSAQRVMLGAGAGVAGAAGAMGAPMLAGAPVAAAGTVGAGRLINTLLKSEPVRNYIMRDPQAAKSLLAELLMNPMTSRALPVAVSQATSPRP